MTPRDPITITLTREQAEAAAEALNHVWREIFDQSRDGKGGHLDVAVNLFRKALSTST